MRIVWTEDAVADLTEARDYIALDKPDAARRQVQLVLKAVKNLKDMPFMGKPGRRVETRELGVHKTPYIIVYRVKNADIQIVRILHFRQHWPR